MFSLVALFFAFLFASATPGGLTAASRLLGQVFKAGYPPALPCAARSAAPPAFIPIPVLFFAFLLFSFALPLSAFKKLQYIFSGGLGQPEKFPEKLQNKKKNKLRACGASLVSLLRRPIFLTLISF